MTDDPATPPRGRLFLVTGGPSVGRAAVAVALAQRFERAVAIDGDSFEHMVVSGRLPYREPPTSEQLRLRFLRWSAAIATAETYQLEGFDAVISDVVLGPRLEDFLDLAAPEPVHVIVLEGPARVDPDTPPWGLWLRCPPADQATVGATVDEILAHLDEALVPTAD